MPALIACLSSGKGTWSEVNKIIRSQPWSTVFLLTNEFAQQHYTPDGQNVELIPVNSLLELPALVQELKKSLQGKIPDFEVGLNLISGTGKEHMAVLEAVMQLGLNFRLVAVQEGKVGTMGLGR